jgi:hypothetical protein
MEEYHMKYPTPTVASPQSAHLGQPRTFMILGARYGLSNMVMQAEEPGAQLIDPEYNAYVTCNLAHINTNPLVFWELEQEQYPTIFRMAMDYLPVQPSSVPCERAFSSSGLTDTKQCNQITLS